MTTGQPARPSPVAAPARRARTVRERLGPAYRRVRDLALTPVYAFYLQRLRARVLSEPRPEHIAVIMDGNRRWATAEGFADPGAGHRAGAEKALELIDWCAELGIHEITLWALSLENLGRPADEVGTITDVAEEAIRAMADGRRKTRLPIHLRVIGRRDLLPEGLRSVVESSANLSREDGTMDVTVALAYSGRDELLEAFRSTVRAAAASGIPAEGIADQLTAEIGRRSPLHPRFVGARPDHPDLGRGPPVGLPALAVGLLRAPVLRGLLAGLPGDRLPARAAHVPAAGPPLRPLRVP